MVDIHSHILWGLDDGARDLAESIAMLRIAAESGTTDIVATPHADLKYRFKPDLIAARIAELEAAVDGAPRIHRGCDFHLSFDNIQEAMENRQKFTINGLKYLMVELPEQRLPPTLDEILEGFLGRGIVPVITHPERNAPLRESADRFGRWLAMGCLSQVTAQSLTDQFGKEARIFSWKLIEKGWVHVIASDGHNTTSRPPRMDLARELLVKECGEAMAERLTETNPRAIIEGNSIARNRTSTPQSGKKWFEFWK